jgi:hypothetical protein
MSDERTLNNPGEYHRSQVKKPEDEDLRREATGQEGKRPPKKTTVEETQRRAEDFRAQPENVRSPSTPPITEEWRKDRGDDQDKH